MILSPGARLGPYEILAPLGAGGMGEVYRALDTRLERGVAVEVLPAALTKDVQIPGAALGPGEFITVITADNRFVQTQTQAEIPARIYQTDIQTGVKTLWKEIQPTDRTGVFGIDQIHFTQNGSGYAYTYGRVESSDLYVVEGLK